MPVPVPPTGQDSAPTERKVTMQSEYIPAVITGPSGLNQRVMVSK